jgi:hypothetical protein
MAILVTVESPDADPLRLRMGAVAGVIAVIPLLALGTIWPSIYTVAAVAVAPALLIFLASIIRPHFRRGRALHGYCLVAAWLTPVAWAAHILWLLS